MTVARSPSLPSSNGLPHGENADAFRLEAVSKRWPEIDYLVGCRPPRWTADELARRAQLEQGIAVAVNIRRHPNLIGCAKERGLFVRVDRAT